MTLCIERLTAKVLLGLGVIGLLSTSAIADDATANSTITDIVLQSGGDFDNNRRDFDILLNAVLAADLADALGDPNGDLTVFAPIDRAFIRLARDLGFVGHDEAGAFDFIVAALTELGGGDPIPLLTNVLLYHVSPESKDLDSVLASDVIETLLDDATFVPIRRQLIDNDPDFKNPKIRLNASNIVASNGIIHSVSRVLIPADLPNDESSLVTITELVAASGEFDHNSQDYDLLLNAVLAAGLDADLEDPEADLTVFAPKDIAFIRLARVLGFRGWNEEQAFNFIVEALTGLGGGDPIPLLTDILLYHVSPGAQILKDVLVADEITTLLADATFHPDGRILVDNDSGLRDPRINVGASDLKASNGIVHTINRVLIPIDFSSELSPH